MGIRYRPAVPTDTRAMFDVFHDAIAEIDRHLGTPNPLDPTDAIIRETEWRRRRPLFEHITATADRSWVAVDADDHLRGYARSTLRDGVRELTEFFVHPTEQSAGIGGELLPRAFPADGARHRTIVATMELPALIRYLKAGLAGTTPLGYFSRVPERVEVESDLQVRPMAEAEAGTTLEAIAAIDRALLGHRRDIDHRWLLTQRDGFVYRRGDEIVGYGYVGDESGPFATLDPADMPAVLASAESAAAQRGVSNVGFFVPMVNQAAIGYLLSRGYRLDPFIAIFFTDGPAVRFDSYVLTNPPFFV